VKDHISEQEDREVSIRAHDKFLRIALDNMLEGIQIIGFDWRYIYVNLPCTGNIRRKILWGQL